MSRIIQDAQLHSISKTQNQKNREQAEIFAAQFVPALKVTACDAINGQRVIDGYYVAAYDQETEIGVCAWFYGRGHFKAFAEIVGFIDRASETGALLASILNADEK